VTIGKSGQLDGTIHAKSIAVEKGGIFTGELRITPEPGDQKDALGFHSPPSSSKEVEDDDEI
jgi:cytoskeletal protein CcmA (bactofilin family)